jgi:hypothetical protein
MTFHLRQDCLVRLLPAFGNLVGSRIVDALMLCAQASVKSSPSGTGGSAASNCWQCTFQRSLKRSVFNSPNYFASGYERLIIGELA